MLGDNYLVIQLQIKMQRKIGAKQVTRHTYEVLPAHIPAFQIMLLLSESLHVPAKIVNTAVLMRT